MDQQRSELHRCFRSIHEEALLAPSFIPNSNDTQTQEKYLDKTWEEQCYK